MCMCRYCKGVAGQWTMMNRPRPHGSGVANFDVRVDDRVKFLVR